MKILSIGNSFSEDACHHLSPMALECDDGFCHGNLVIGGCSLERHFNNLLSGEPSYGYQKTGHAVRAFSLKDGINDEDWDIVTLQQVSGDSGHPSTFFPYIFALADYIKQARPDAEIVLHKTWPYNKGSSHPRFPEYGSDPDRMLEEIDACYEEVKKRLGLNRVIPTGNVINRLRRQTDIELYRDNFHLSLVEGRYAASATWFEYLKLGDLMKNSYRPLVEGHRLSERNAEIIKKIIINEVAEYA